MRLCRVRSKGQGSDEGRIDCTEDDGREGVGEALEAFRRMGDFSN